MKVMHTADLHLRNYKDERWRTLETLVAIGKKLKIAILVISGDLFDKNSDAENLRPQIRSIFSNNGFKIVLICGNHDQFSYKKGMYFGEDVVILSDLMQPFQYQDVKIWGMPFARVEKNEIIDKIHSLSKVLNPEEKNILLYHGELLDTFFSRRDFGDEGEERYMPVKLSYFKDLKIDYILAGHFHTKFEVRRLKNQGYFVYPGSPIAITKKETGIRRVNVFEIGKPPQEYLLDTFHFEEMVIEFDPFTDKRPLEIVEKYFNNFHIHARVILTIKGFVNGDAIGMSEVELKRLIDKIVADRCDEVYYEVRDVRVVFEDELFKNFVEKLKKRNYSEKKKKQMCNTIIKAIMETHL
ncbi:metallophosphoesterase [bacterium]|nr:metallophosphoesterase [bacterium]